MNNRKDIYKALEAAWSKAEEGVSVHMFYNPANRKHVVCINDDRYEFVEKAKKKANAD